MCGFLEKMFKLYLGGGGGGGTTGIGGGDTSERCSMWATAVTLVLLLFDSRLPLSG